MGKMKRFMMRLGRRLFEHEPASDRDKTIEKILAKLKEYSFIDTKLPKKRGLHCFSIELLLGHGGEHKAHQTLRDALKEIQEKETRFVETRKDHYLYHSMEFAITLAAAASHAADKAYQKERDGAYLAPAYYKSKDDQKDNRTKIDSLRQFAAEMVGIWKGLYDEIPTIELRKAALTHVIHGRATTCPHELHTLALGLAFSVSVTKQKTSGEPDIVVFPNLSTVDIEIDAPTEQPVQPAPVVMPPAPIPQTPSLRVIVNMASSKENHIEKSLRLAATELYGENGLLSGENGTGVSERKLGLS